MQKSHTWKQSGKINLWRYTENKRNYPGWNLSADRAGCTSLLELLGAFSADIPPVTRTLSILPPAKAQLLIPNNRSGTAAWVSPKKWRITLVRDIEYWYFPQQLEPAELTLGANWLSQFAAGISDILKGQGDYSIGCSDQTNLLLWFWWQPKNLSS